MIKNILIICLLYATNLFAQYNVGDKLNNELINKLNLQKNKIYVLDFFASWCVSCKIELPKVSMLNNKIDKSKYEIIGINVDEDRNEANEFVKNLDLNFKIIYDTSNEIIRTFEPIGVPAIYYIKDYKIQKVVFGAIEDIDIKILNSLKELGK